MEIMEKYHLSPNEIFVTRVLLLAKESYAENYIVRYMTLPESVRGSLLNTLHSLQNKGVILKSYKIPNKGEKFDFNTVQINQNVEKTFHRAAFDLGFELFQTYPMFGNINGVTVSLRGVAKKFNDLEDFYRYYGKTIKWNPNVHNDIIELVEWAKNNTQYLNMSIATFVIERKWEELKALKEGDLINVNYDTIKLL
jgi:hypothetical protein